MKGGGGNFLVKPRPDYLKDIILSKEKISKFMLGVLLNSTVLAILSLKTNSGISAITLQLVTSVLLA